MTVQYSYIVIDDDDFARETLIDHLNEYSELKLLKSISESGMAIKHLVILQPDLIFLDINMPDKSGMDVQKEILELELNSKVIFITAHEEHVLEAFKNKAFDYLIKPISTEELRETLQRFFAEREKLVLQKGGENTEIKNGSEIIIKSASGVLKLKSDEVLYIEAEGTYTKLHFTNGKTELLTKNLGKVEHLFSTEDFFKISRSYIININYLKKADRINKTVCLSAEKLEVKLKASRDRFYDLERKI